MLCCMSLFMFVLPNYKFYFLFDTWNIIKSNLVGTIACMPPHAPCTRSRFFFSVPPNDPKLHAYPTMTMACMRDKYRSFATLDAISRVFWRQNPTTLPPRDATCVLCPNSCTPCLGDHIGHAHMVPKVGVISCMPPHAPCTSRTIRVCRRAGLKVVFLAGPTN